MGFFVYRDGRFAHFFCQSGTFFMRKLNPQLQERLEKLISSMGFEFVGGEMLPQGRQLVLRIYIDKTDGLSVDHCTLVSRQVGAMLDAEDLMSGNAYYLEVSSPGIDRPLFEVTHFQRYVGSRAKIKLNMAIAQRRQFTGTLQRVEGEDIHLLIDNSDEQVVLPYSAIDRANLVGDVTISSRKKTGRGNKPVNH
jgi:ribosome maturation factor RimP